MRSQWSEHKHHGNVDHSCQGGNYNALVKGFSHQSHPGPHDGLLDAQVPGDNRDHGYDDAQKQHHDGLRHAYLHADHAAAQQKGSHAQADLAHSPQADAQQQAVTPTHDVPRMARLTQRTEKEVLPRVFPTRRHGHHDGEAAYQRSENDRNGGSKLPVDTQRQGNGQPDEPHTQNAYKVDRQQTREVIPIADSVPTLHVQRQGARPRLQRDLVPETRGPGQQVALNNTQVSAKLLEGHPQDDCLQQASQQRHEDEADNA